MQKELIENLEIIISDYNGEVCMVGSKPDSYFPRCGREAVFRVYWEHLDECEHLDENVGLYCLLCKEKYIDPYELFKCKHTCWAITRVLRLEKIR